MRFFIFLFVFPALLLGEIGSQVGGIPVSAEEVTLYADHTIAQFEEAMTTFKNLSSSERNFQNTVVAWNIMMESVWAKTITLAVLSLAVSDDLVLFKAQRELLFLMAKLQGACRDLEALQIIKEFANSSQAKKLNAGEAYQLSTLLASGGVDWSLKGMLPYTALKGKVDPVEKEEVTVLNWNVCFFPSSLSLLFGGVLPWEDRIEGVANQIIESKADIVCLQEMFSAQAGEKLYRLLEKEYAYFYINIGLKPFGFNSDEIGLSSGLFVASKVEVKNPQFIPFQKTPTIRGYGLFSIDISPIGNLITTHLNPGSDPVDLEYRKEQIQEILTFIETEKKSHSTFLCGDLNIERNSSEYKEVIEPKFNDPYFGKGWTCLELRNYWWKAGQNVEKFKALGFSYESIDYFICPKGKKNRCSVTTNLIQVNDPMHPEKALSDHQAMFSTLKLQGNS
jgi:hypothetical protein